MQQLDYTMRGGRTLKDADQMENREEQLINKLGKTDIKNMVNEYNCKNQTDFLDFQSSEKGSFAYKVASPPR